VIWNSHKVVSVIEADIQITLDNFKHCLILIDFPFAQIDLGPMDGRVEANDVNVRLRAVGDRNAI